MCFLANFLFITCNRFEIVTVRFGAPLHQLPAHSRKGMDEPLVQTGHRQVIVTPSSVRSRFFIELLGYHALNSDN